MELIHTWNKDVGQYYEDRITEQKKQYSERFDSFPDFNINYTPANKVNYNFTARCTSETFTKKLMATL